MRDHTFCARAALGYNAGMRSEQERLNDARIPPVGAVPQAERMFRVNWVAAELRSPSGVPMLLPDYVAQLGRVARVVDLRAAEELTGPLGYIPGSDWIPRASALEQLAMLPKDEAVVLVSRGGERAAEVALALEARGHRFVAALMGGIVAWRQVGLSTTRDAAILSREGALPALRPVWEATQRALSREDVERHVGDPRGLRWMKLAAMLVSGRLSCVDGRADAGVVGTPGGDAGEFLLAVAALESVTGRRLDDAAMRTLMLGRLDTFGRFYLHTDVDAFNALIRSMRDDRRLDDALADVSGPLAWRRFMRAPPLAARGAALEHMVIPAHMGCGHMRLAAQRAADYGLRPELVGTFLRTFLTLRWEGVEENEITVLPGGHAEGAVVNVLIEGGAEAYARIPLVSPMAGGSQMFLQHPQVAAFLRGQLAHFLARTRAVGLAAGGEAALNARMSALGDAQLGHTLAALAPGLPVYDVTFDDDGRVRVEARGAVPG